MLLLTGTSALIQLVTGSSGTIEVHRDYVDRSAGVDTPVGDNVATISTATTKTPITTAPCFTAGGTEPGRP